MQIKASAKLDYNTVKYLTRMNLSVKNNPRNSMIIVLSVCAIFICIFLFLASVSSVSVGMILGLILDILLFIFVLFLYFLMPKIRFSCMGKMQNTVIEYIFCDNVVKVNSASETYSSLAEFRYDMLRRVAETSRYFLLFQTHNQAYVVDKSTFTPAEANVLRGRAIACPGVKYIPYKY